MIRIFRAVRPALPLAALGMFLFIASALALPQQAEAQMACSGCIWAGEDPGPGKETEGTGVGQPGYGWDCGSQPEGMTECNVGTTWCETGGSMCQSLMFLDFTEDGMPSWETAADEQPATTTCDGVLLRDYVLDDRLPSYEAGTTLVL